MGMNWAQMFRDEQSRWTGAYNAVANAIYDTTNKVVYKETRLGTIVAAENVIYELGRNATRRGINDVMLLELSDNAD